ncbi:ComEC/Rec2 family competence protein [Frondihabitans sp. 4ASC-45]|uniref:ComEC/Rec2 family competence protein n=1 Tax=Frondihabitans sp. 4ASC-45 TaxID=3111636 RepID=UPI003C27140B
MIDVRLGAPAALGWAALAGVLPQPGALGPTAAVCGGVGVAALGSCALVARRWRSTLASVSLALLVVALLAAIAALQAPARTPERLVALADRSATVEVTGRVVGVPTADRVALAVTEVRARGVPVVSGANVPMLVLGLEAERLPGADDRVLLTGRLGVADPGGSVAFLLRPAGDIEVVSRAYGVHAVAATLRESFARTSHGLTGDGGDLLPGLTIGDTSHVDEGLDAAMKASSLAHLTAVSGANCAVLVALILAIGAFLRGPRILVSSLAIVVLAGFVVLVTPDPSVVRAAVMAVLALVAQAVGRPVRGLPLVSLAVVILLIIDPWLARSYAFALSVLATAGLVVLTRPLVALLARVMPEPLALALAVPVAAQAAVQPLLLSLDPGIAVLGVPANVLADPAAPLATVLGLMACLLGPVWPFGAGVAAAAAWAPASWIALVARGAAALPSMRLETDGSLLAIVVCVVATALAGVAILLPSRRRSRLVTTLVLAGLLLPLGAVAVGGTLGRRATLPPDWQIAQCDVGQGDAVLLRSAERVALVDTGDDATLLRSCLDLLAIQRLDLLVLTHFDADHVGAAASLTGRVQSLLVGPSGGPVDERLVSTLRRGGATVIDARPKESLDLGDLSLEVLWPPEKTEAGNGASVALRVEPRVGCAGSCLSAVLLGDLDETAQRRLLGRGLGVGPVDVVKVSHHGSRDQSPELYRSLGARVALIGVGAGNTYGHPVPATVRLLERTGARVVRSDRDGTVALTGTADGRISLWQSGARPASAGAPRLDDEPNPVGAAWLSEGRKWRARRARPPPRRPRSSSCRGTESGPRE